MSNHVLPWSVVEKIRPKLELMTTSLLLTELTAKLAPPVSGSREAAGLLEQPEGSTKVRRHTSTADTGADELEEVGIADAGTAAGPEVLEGRARTLLVGAHAAGVAARAAPADIPIADDVRI